MSTSKHAAGAAGAASSSVATGSRPRLSAIGDASCPAAAGTAWPTTAATPATTLSVWFTAAPPSGLWPGIDDHGRRLSPGCVSVASTWRRERTPGGQYGSEVVEVRVLGPVELVDGASVVRLPHAQRTLLAALAARLDERVSVDVLV